MSKKVKVVVVIYHNAEEYKEHCLRIGKEYKPYDWLKYKRHVLRRFKKKQKTKK